MLQLGEPNAVLAGVRVRAAGHRGQNVLVLDIGDLVFQGFLFIRYVTVGVVKYLFQVVAYMEEPRGPIAVA